MIIIQTPAFAKQLKKLHKNQKLDLDCAIKEIVKNPNIGTTKKGDLSDIQVYKFNMVNQQVLLAYEWDVINSQLILHACGSHENFYRDLKK